MIKSSDDRSAGKVDVKIERRVAGVKINLWI